MAVAAFLAAGAAGAEPATPVAGAIGEIVTQMFPPGYCDSGTRRTIGIWTFDRDRVPVAPNVADRIHAEAVSELVTRKPGCVDVLDGSAIRDIADHLKRTGAFREAGDNPLLALEHANRNIDVLLKGEIIAQRGELYLVFRAVERTTAVVLAQTRTWPLPEDYVRSAAEDLALALDTALARAANHLVARAQGLRTLVPLGVFYQDTDAQPPLARYVLAGLMSAIENETTSLVSGPKIRVAGPGLDLSAKSGAPVNLDDFDPAAGAGGRITGGIFELSGRYWLVGDAIDLKLTLASRDGHNVSWQGRVRLKGLPPVEAAPRNPALARGLESAFLFQMTSPRGPSPYYRPGEALTVFLRSAREAWVTCYYIDVNGLLMRVLPNALQEGEVQGSRIPAGQLRVLPDPRTDPFEFRFTADTLGEEALRCFAATKDPSPHLPDALKTPGFEPVAPHLAAQIPGIFHSLPGMLVAEAQLTVTVGNDEPPAAPPN